MILAWRFLQKNKILKSINTIFLFLRITAITNLDICKNIIIIYIEAEIEGYIIWQVQEHL